jgi:hypothetical protein
VGMVDEDLYQIVVLLYYDIDERHELVMTSPMLRIHVKMPLHFDPHHRPLLADHLIVIVHHDVDDDGVVVDDDVDVVVVVMHLLVHHLLLQLLLLVLALLLLHYYYLYYWLEGHGYVLHDLYYVMVIYYCLKRLLVSDPTITDALRMTKVE